ncbi:MAG: hypothetical protein ACRDAO_04140 [Culicoidibacterales bacterium]
MEFICVIPKDLRVKQEILLGRDLKEIGIVAGASLAGFLLGITLGLGNTIVGVIGLAIGLLISGLITQPITAKQNTLSYYRIIRSYYKSQKIYKTAPLSMHIVRENIEKTVDIEEK